MSAPGAADTSAWSEVRLRTCTVRVPPAFSRIERFPNALQVGPPGGVSAWLNLDHRSRYRLRGTSQEWAERFEEDLLDHLTDLYTTIYRADCTRLYGTARTLDGKPAVDLGYRILDRGWDGTQAIVRYHRWVGILAQGHVYTFAFHCPIDDRDDYDSLVEGIVASFRQTEPLKPAEPPPPAPIPTAAQQQPRYTLAEVDALLEPGQGYDLPRVHVVVPALGDGLVRVVLSDEDAEREPVEAEAPTDGHGAALNRLVALGSTDRARIEALLFEHYRLCVGVTDYGVVKNPMDDPFDLATPEAAYARADLREIVLSADGLALLFQFCPVWEQEHGCLIAWRDDEENGGAMTRTDW